MKLKNILLVVEDIERSRAFYEELFGLRMIADLDGNMILTEGLVLQDRKIWEGFVEQEISYRYHSAELYFEENEMDRFLARLENSRFSVSYVHPPLEHDWGQRVVRIYDPDGHMIEVGEAMEYVARRFLEQGMSKEETAKKTQMPLSAIEIIWQTMEEI